MDPPLKEADFTLTGAESKEPLRKGEGHSLSHTNFKKHGGEKGTKGYLVNMEGVSLPSLGRKGDELGDVGFFLPHLREKTKGLHGRRSDLRTKPGNPGGFF